MQKGNHGLPPMGEINIPFKVYLGSSSAGTFLKASGISVSLILDARDVAEFTCDDTAAEQAIAQKTDVYIEYNDGATTKGAFLGFVSAVSTAFPRKVSCIGLTGKLDWFIVNEGASKTLQDEGTVHSLSTDPEHGIECYNLENDHGVDITGYVPTASETYYYLIVSDHTTDETTQICKNGANGWIGYADDSNMTELEANTYASIDDDMDPGGVNWETGINSPTESTVYYSRVYLQVENYEITKTVTPTTMRISGIIDYTIGPYTNGFGMKNKLTINLYLGTKLIYSGDTVLSSQGLVDTTKTLYFNDLEIDLRNYNPFTIGDTYLEGGIIEVQLIETRHNYTPAFTASKIFVEWKCLTASFDYETLTFDTVNNPITDSDGNYIAYTGAVDYVALGVAASDRWAIGVDYNIAINGILSAQLPMSASSDLALVVHEGVSIGKGIAKNLFGATGYELLTTYIEDLEYHFWFDMISKAIIVNNYAGMGDAIALATPHEGSVATIDRYCPAYCAVIWRDGIEVAATGVSGAKGIEKVQQESILTRAEAAARASAMATKYASIVYSIECNYTGTPLVAASATDIPRPGRRYTVTLYNNDGTTTEYATEPLRRVTITNNGGDEHFSTKAFLGMGSTPYHERVPKEIAKLKQGLRDQQLSLMSSSYTPITRHGSLAGIYGNADQYHTDSSFGAMAVETTWSDSDTKLCSSKGIKTKTDATYAPIAPTATVAHGQTGAVSGDTVEDVTKLLAPLASPTFTGVNTLKDEVVVDAQNFKHGAAIQWGTSGTPTGLTISGTIDTSEVEASYLSHLYPAHFVGDIGEDVAAIPASATDNWFSVWFCPKLATTGFLVGMLRSGGWACYFYFDNVGNLYESDKDGNNTLISAYVADTWIHLAIHYQRGVLIDYYVNEVLVKHYAATNAVDVIYNDIYPTTDNSEYRIDAWITATTRADAIRNYADGQLNAKDTVLNGRSVISELDAIIARLDAHGI